MTPFADPKSLTRSFSPVIEPAAKLGAIIDDAYQQAGAELNATGKTVAVAVHRIRRRFRHVVRCAIADTVSTPDEIEEEYQRLFA